MFFSPNAFLLFTGTPPVTPQYARPSSDISDGNWLPSTGTDLYACIDEASYDDGDFIYTLSLGKCVVKLSAVSDPGVHTNHVVRYRAQGNDSTDILVALLQGASELASWTETNASSATTTYSHTLTAGEAATITDYTDLRLSFEAA